MSAEDSNPSGTGATVRRIVDSVTALLHNRVQLFAIEWQEERHRAVDLILRLGLVLSAGAITLALTVLTLAVAVWLRWGLPGLLGLSALLLAVTAGLAWWFARWFNRQAPPFASTVAEFRKDREWLNKKS
jgi:uncharacterized membrane protein YqjE